MAQHDYVIANGTGAAVRSDLNNALAAIVSNNSGATEPTTTYAYMWWPDTSTGLLKLRNGANNAWITLRELDGTLTIEDGTASSPGLAFADDLNTGIYSPSADQLGITTGGTVRLTTTTTGITSALPVDVPLGTASAPTVTFTGDLNTGIYSPGADQVAISTNGTGRLFIDSSGRAGIGTSSPTTTLDVRRDGANLYQARIINKDASVDSTRAAIEFENDTGVIGYIGTHGSNSSANLGSEYANALNIFGSNAKGVKIVASNASGYFAVNTGGSGSANERLRIDSSGRVGIGTTSPSVALDVNGNGSFKSSIIITDSQTKIGDSGVIDGGAADGNTQINFFTGKSLIFKNSAAERARIDSSGRLLVGTSSARGYGDGNIPFVQVERATIGGDIANIGVCNNGDNGAGPKFTLAKSRSGSNGGVTVVQNGDSLGSIQWSGADGTDIESVAAQITCNVDGTPGANDMPGRLVFSTTRDGQSSPTQALVIKESQETLFTTSTSAVSATGWYGVQANAQVGAVSISRNGSNVMAFFHTSNANGLAGAPVGTISITTTATSYNTSSDYRLKENVEPVTDGITRLQQLKPSRFNFIADPDKTVDGFLAHEVAEVVPECVTGEKDAVDEDGNPVYQGIDQSKLVPLLTAALQEAVAKIETLEARLTAAGIA